MTSMSDRTDSERPFHLGKYFAQVMGWGALLGIGLAGAVMLWAGGKNLVTGAFEQSDWIAALVGLTMLAAVSWPLWRYRPDFTMGEPQTRRGNRIRWGLVAIVLVAIATSGLTMVHSMQSGDPDPYLLFKNAPLPTDIAMSLLVLWAIAIPAIALTMRRNSDDFKRATGDFGMMIGGQVFTYIAPLWWIAWRGGLMPRPDAMILFVITLVVINIAMFWKHYHG